MTPPQNRLAHSIHIRFQIFLDPRQCNVKHFHVREKFWGCGSYPGRRRKRRTHTPPTHTTTTDEEPSASEMHAGPTILNAASCSPATFPHGSRCALGQPLRQALRARCHAGGTLACPARCGGSLRNLKQETRARGAQALGRPVREGLAVACCPGSRKCGATGTISRQEEKF